MYICIIIVIIIIIIIIIIITTKYSDATEKELTVCSCHVTYFHWVKLF